MNKEIKTDSSTFVGILILIVFIILLFVSGCEASTSSSGETVNKPATKQVCDWVGWNSDNIIKEQYEQGYVFTGKTQGFICDNLLNFQLKEVNDKK